MWSGIYPVGSVTVVHNLGATHVSSTVTVYATNISFFLRAVTNYVQ